MCTWKMSGDKDEKMIDKKERGLRKWQMNKRKNEEYKNLNNKRHDKERIDKERQKQ